MTTLEDTTSYQHTSLATFMSVLGYEAYPENKWVWKCEGKPTIKFNTAVDWHNQHTSEFVVVSWLASNSGLMKMLEFAVNRNYPYVIVKSAYESRLVAQVKLKQLKTGEIVTENHLVKYLNK